MISKRIVAAFFALGSAACAGGGASGASKGSEGSPTLLLGTTRWSPYTDNSDRKHWALDLVREGLERSGIRVRFQVLPDGALEQAAASEFFAGAAALWRSEERERRFLYSDAFLENRLVLASGNGSNVEHARLEDIGAKRVAIVASYAYGSALERAKDTTFVKASSLEEIFRAMLAGDTDYALADQQVVQRALLALSQEEQSRVRVGSRALLSRTLHLALRRDFPEAGAFVTAFNERLPTMIDEGTFHRILGTSWILTDLDQDEQSELVAANAAAVSSGEPDQGLVFRVPLKGKEALETGRSPLFRVAGRNYATWAEARAAVGIKD